MLFLVIEGRLPGYSTGATMNDVINILLRYKAYNAANLDGGASTTMSVEGKLWNKPSVGLSLNEDDMRYKLYLNDTGLLISHAFDEDPRSLNELYKKLMLGKLEVNKGMLIENMVAQMLRATGKKLFFFAHNDAKDSENTMEIDFLMCFILYPYGCMPMMSLVNS